MIDLFILSAREAAEEENYAALRKDIDKEVKSADNEELNAVKKTPARKAVRAEKQQEEAE